MRRLLCITLIGLLLMNVMGYYGVFMGLKMRNDEAMVKKLDLDDFDPSQVVKLKIPLALPYSSDAQHFERVDGTFEHKGQVFRLLKQKLSADTLTIICVRDANAQKINTALRAYLKTFLEEHASQSSGKLTFIFIKDYVPESFSVKTLTNWWVKEVTHSSVIKTFIASFMNDIVHPPERI